MKTSDYLEVIAAPEVQEQRENLYQLGAPVGKFQQEAFRSMELQVERPTKEEAIVFIADCLLAKAKAWEARREPKTRGGKIIKWIIGILPSFGK